MLSLELLRSRFFLALLPLGFDLRFLFFLLLLESLEDSALHLPVEVGTTVAEDVEWEGCLDTSDSEGASAAGFPFADAADGRPIGSGTRGCDVGGGMPVP